MQGLYPYGHGISAVDVLYERERLNAVHLLVERGRAAIIDSGTAHGVPRVLAALELLGVAPSDVDYVVLTHVHLDHAGGAGQLMARCPNAVLTVHPRGARHMIDPRRLLAATVRIYGEETTRRVYGEVLPVAAGRVLETPEGARISLAGRALQFFDAPGHARHQVVLRDARTGHFFAGDTFGLSYRELDRDGRQFSFPTTSPSQFDPPALKRSIRRMLALEPQAIYVTHFGQVHDPLRLGADLCRLIDAHVAIAERCRGAGAQRNALLRKGIAELLREESRRQEWPLSDDELMRVFAIDVDLNAQGLEAWLDSGAGG
ncbi:MAG TPA: MBL fold metallo-hydrolase [Burkholderiales bacterium]|nr:MBL fold metallo-hydrolase [Burkholderiales bacterium]